MERRDRPKKVLAFFPILVERAWEIREEEVIWAEEPLEIPLRKLSPRARRLKSSWVGRGGELERETCMWESRP